MPTRHGRMEPESRSVRDRLLQRVRIGGVTEAQSERVAGDLAHLLTRIDDFDEAVLRRIEPVLRPPPTSPPGRSSSRGAALPDALPDPPGAVVDPATTQQGVLPARPARGSPAQEVGGSAAGGPHLGSSVGSSFPDLPAPTLSAISALLAAGELTATDLITVVLNRVEALNRVINAFVTVDEEGAWRTAREADRRLSRGARLGPLDGIPIALKDVYLTADMPTTAGSRFFAQLAPKRDAFSVARLRAAGAIIVGKTNTHEFALGTTTENPHHGPTRNPWDTSRVSGGSSGGSAAALAAGLVLGATGSDTGGSIRVPAALCGLVGVKPTYGRVSRSGLVPLSWSLDHAGPLARTVEDAALLLQVMAGYDSADPSSIPGDVPSFTARLRAGVAGMRVGRPKQFFLNRIDEQVAAAFEQSLRQWENLGAKVEEIDWPTRQEAHDAITVTSLLISVEGATWHEPLLRQRAGEYGDDVRHRLELGRHVQATEYLKMVRIGRWLNEQLRRAFATVDMIVTPTCPVTAFPLGTREVVWEGEAEPAQATLIRLTRIANLTGWPALSVPCGLSAQGLPIGLQLIGRPFDEATLLRAAWAYEQAQGVLYAGADR